MEKTDLRLIKPVIIWDSVNEADIFTVPVRVIHISNQIVFDFSYMKKANEISPPCRQITYEMCNRFSQLQRFKGYMWETSYQKLIIDGNVSIPFLSMGNFIMDSSLNYSLIVHSERNFMSLIPVPTFNSERKKTEFIVGRYWGFFMWAQENLYEYWND